MLESDGVFFVSQNVFERILFSHVLKFATWVLFDFDMHRLSFFAAHCSCNAPVCLLTHSHFFLPPLVCVPFVCVPLFVSRRDGNGYRPGRVPGHVGIVWNPRDRPSHRGPVPGGKSSFILHSYTEYLTSSSVFLRTSTFLTHQHQLNYGCKRGVGVGVD